MAQVVEHLLCKCKALSSNCTPTHHTKERKPKPKPKNKMKTNKNQLKLCGIDGGKGEQINGTERKINPENGLHEYVN
jgi:hypothetical protein